MSSPIDPNEVRLTGENSFIRLGAADAVTTHASHWRVIVSPAGSGHVLFFKSDLNGDELRLYSDNIALARWLQRDVQATMRPEYGDPSLPVIEARFSREGEVATYWTERVDTAERGAVPDLVRAGRGVRRQKRGGQHPGPAPRRVQLHRSGGTRPGDAQRPRRGGRRLSARPRRTAQQLILPGLLGDLGQAPPVACPASPVRRPRGSAGYARAPASARRRSWGESA